MLNAPRKLPTRDLLPLATTVERVYEETPTWLLGVLLLVATIVVLALGVERQSKVDDYADCIYANGRSAPQCADIDPSRK